MQAWEYKVAYVDFSGRVSVEGEETLIGQERKTTFVRRFLDQLGKDGWEISAAQPVSPHAAYYVFKRPAAGTGESA